MRTNGLIGCLVPPVLALPFTLIASGCGFLALPDVDPCNSPDPEVRAKADCGSECGGDEGAETPDRTIGVAGCADDFIEATCDGEVNTVVKGSVRGLEVDIESLEVVGSLDKDRFYLAFEAPASPRPENGGTWLLDFGFNPLGGTTSSATLSDNMAKWYGQIGGPKPFWITSRDSGVPCDPLRGSLCGGFGVDTDSSGELEREQSAHVERYHRFIEGEEFVGAGTVNFEVLTPEEWKATFSVTIDADELEPIMLGGKLEGCFHTLLVPRGKTREFASP